jgi:hypothetical protein
MHTPLALWHSPHEQQTQGLSPDPQGRVRDRKQAASYARAALRHAPRPPLLRSAVHAGRASGGLEVEGAASQSRERPGGQREKNTGREGRGALYGVSSLSTHKCADVRLSTTCRSTHRHRKSYSVIHDRYSAIVEGKGAGMDARHFHSAQATHRSPQGAIALGYCHTSIELVSELGCLCERG